MARATFWATVEPTFGREYDPKRCEYVEIVTKARVTGITQSRPDSRKKVGTVTMKLTIDIPDGAFLPLRPEAIVVVPEDMVAANLPIEVEAEDANAEPDVED